MIYAYANIIVEFPEQLTAYRERAGEALARHGGQVLHTTPEQTILEGESDQLGIGAILGFDSKEGALAWINDPELSEIHALRNSIGRSTVTLLA